MAGPRGKAQGGKTAVFPADAPVRAAAVLHPNDPAHAAFRWLLEDMKGKSQAEVVREALNTLYAQRKAAQAEQQPNRTKAEAA